MPPVPEIQIQDLWQVGAFGVGMYFLSDFLKWLINKLIDKRKGATESAASACLASAMEHTLKDMRDSMERICRSQEEIAIGLERSAQVNESVLTGLKDLSAQVKDGFKEMESDMRGVLKAVGM